MTVPVQEPSINHTGNGITTMFPFPFTILQSEDLVVLLDGIEQIVGAQYTINGIGDQDGGSVTFIGGPPTSGALISLFREVALDRATDYQDNGDLLAGTVNSDFDRIWMAMQDSNFTLSRAVRVPRTDQNPSMVLPTAPLRANKALGFNDSGDAISIGLTIGSVQTPVVDNRTMLRAVSTDTEEVFVAGADGLGDNGGGLYLPVRSVAPSDWDDDGIQIKTTTGRGYQLADTESISAAVYGAKGDPTNDEHAAYQKAIDWVYARGGGVVFIPPGARSRIGSALDILPGVTLSGRVHAVGSPGTNVSAPYGSLGGALLLGPSATVNVHSNASFKSGLLYPYGMTFPQLNAASWAGQAVQLMGDDANVELSAILGFQQAIIGGGVQRPTLRRLKIDCVNGVDLEQVLDIATLDKLHFWPFACIAATSKPSNWSDRLGTAINLHDTVDWANVLDCFAYNYNVGAIINGVAQTTLSNFKTDGPFTVAAGTGRAGTIGVLVEGNSVLTRLIDPQINSAQNSLVVNIPRGSGYSVAVDGGSLNSSGSPITGPYNGAAVLVQSGDVKLNTRLHYHSNGVRVTNADSIVTGNVDFGDVAQDVVCDVPTTNVYLNKATFGTEQANGKQVVVGQLGIPAVSTASGGLNLPMNAKAVFASAEASFGAVSGGYAGRVVTIVFSGPITVFSNDSTTMGGVNIRLLNNTNWNVQAGYTLTILHDGQQWREIARTT
ncbi:hypothetical protein [Burkholderia gladioli]|uniref:hypothetical protein n=1 Tax=Burkholderia gladioli TaxID=28095 RepID=UPI00163E2F9F|nr:hypothetical protein [Burkholderia gladioli]